MEKVFLDPDVILDLNLKRELHFLNAIRVFKASRRFQYVTTSISIANAYYFVAKDYNARQAKSDLGEISNHIKMLNVKESAIHAALEMLSVRFNDFEVAVQHNSSMENNAECIFTCYGKDFSNASLLVYSPKLFLEHFPA